MKIALVSPYDFTWPGGVTVHISHLSHRLLLMGHEVKILTPFSPSRADEPNHNVVPLGRTLPIPTGGSVARISLSAWLYRKVQDVLRRENFDVIHLHEPLAPYLPLAVLQSSRSVNVGTFHAFHGSNRWYRWSRPILSHWFKRLDGLIAVSPAARGHISRSFPGEYKLIPNGIDLDVFGKDVPPLPQFLDGKINILFVGRLDKRKGLQYLLQAYSDLKWKFPDIRLIVVGPSAPDKNCSRIMASRGLDDVIFAGPVSHHELPRYYSSADIFCAPSTGKESFGIVLLEAMASSKPIVASRIEGYSYVVTHGHQALLTTPKAPDSLADALTLLIQNRELRLIMGARGRQAVEVYSWDVVARQVLDFYYETLEKRDDGKISRKN